MVYYIEPKEAVHNTEVDSMSRRKTKRQKQQIVKYESNNISQEQMIEIQAEAYYRALKRIEDEKTKEDEQKPERRKYKWYEEVLFCINVFFWPWKINKRFSVSKKFMIVFQLCLFLALCALLADFCGWRG